MVLLNFVALLAGFYALLKGADYLVDGSSSIAKKYGISSLVIGLTVVAFGTSAPELVVAVFSSIAGSNGLIIGNVIGSNIFNTLFVMGIASMIAPISIEIGQNVDIIFNILITILLLIFIYSGKTKPLKKMARSPFPRSLCRCASVHDIKGILFLKKYVLLEGLL